MPGLRDHDPFIIEQFNGLWRRGDDESCPSDHFIVANNVQYFESGVETRPPIDKYQIGTTPLRNIVRIYNYVTQVGQSLLVLTYPGKLYHYLPSGTLYGPILDIPTMEDFGFVSIAGRAYITPHHTLTDATGQRYQLGLPGEFVYVYKGDGSPVRKAAGAGPINANKKSFIAFNDTKDGTITKGVHIIAVMGNDQSLLTGNYSVVEAPGNLKIQLTNIPIGPVGITGRLIYMTHAIDPKDYTGNPASYQYFLADTIPDNATTSKKIDGPDSGFTVQYPGAPPTTSDPGGLTVNNTTIDGFCDTGFHIVGVVYETDTGYLTAPGPETFGANTYIDVKKQIAVGNIPTSPDSFVKKRHLISTKAIPEYNGDQKGYQFFFIPKGVLEDNTSTTKNVSYYDSDLVSDASHLLDNYSAIPAGVNLNTYHGRMVLVGDPTYPEKEDGTPDTTKPDNRSVARLSAPGEPEAISKVDGLIIAPLDGSPLTNCQEFRDILYLFKKTRTYAYVDNSDEPSTWGEEIIDQGVGAPVHGIAAVLDSGGVNIDYLLITDWSGLMLFNGTYARPELSFKIEDLWQTLTRNFFNHIQIVNDSISKKIYITCPPPLTWFMLFADYANGLDSKSIRWSQWIFDGAISSVSLIESNKIIIGAFI